MVGTRLKNDDMRRDRDGAVHLYILALGSNRPLSVRLLPPAILRAAVATLTAAGHQVHAIAPLLDTPPLGPSRRRYANSALLVSSHLPPDALLHALQAIEARFGRRRAQRWGARTLDIDIILWSGGRWNRRNLIIPHPAFRERDFVLMPLLAIAPAWRDPVTGLRPAHLLARHKKVLSFP
jgi:2-amino-4-hydroxy-6-hydroxymethyldihydropteridine diphosphokinase